MNNILDTFYRDNQSFIDDAWSEYLSFGEWGSGEDRIEITDDMFWEFVEEIMDKEKEAV